jgi:hypothetical protein
MFEGNAELISSDVAFGEEGKSWGYFVGIY